MSIGGELDRPGGGGDPDVGRVLIWTDIKGVSIQSCRELMEELMCIKNIHSSFISPTICNYSIT